MAPRTMKPARAAANAVPSETTQLSAANGARTYTIPGGWSMKKSR